MERVMKGGEGLVQGANCRAGEEMEEGSETDLRDMGWSSAYDRQV